MTTKDPTTRTLAILPTDRRYVTIDEAGAYRLTNAAQTMVEGIEGIVARFERGASIEELAIDYDVPARAIEAAIRTMPRYQRGET